jgi:DNA-3-methyladenine glycosylase
VQAADALPRTFFARSPVTVARELLGMTLVHESPDGLVAGRLVETEAYDGPDDRASHARFGRTSRTAPMFGPAGHAYVFLVYGLHECLNVVTGTAGEPGAVLLRAAAPLVGLDLMRRRRGRPHEPDARLAAGPGRLGVAFAVGRRFSGADLLDGPLRIVSAIAEPGEPRRTIVAGPRIGVAYAGEPWTSVPWRFVVSGDPSVSR